jgi:F-type H+-transporting ATPase subunit c
MKIVPILFAFLTPLVLITSALASDGAAAMDTSVLKYVAYFFAVSIAAFGGTQGQSVAAAAALEGIARNPSAADKIQTPMILSMALIESLVIFSLISPIVIG